VAERPIALAPALRKAAVMDNKTQYHIFRAQAGRIPDIQRLTELMVQWKSILKEPVPSTFCGERHHMLPMFERPLPVHDWLDAFKLYPWKD
jgi:hypothetical protein